MINRHTISGKIDLKHVVKYQGLCVCNKTFFCFIHDKLLNINKGSKILKSSIANIYIYKYKLM